MRQFLLLVSAALGGGVLAAAIVLSVVGVRLGDVGRARTQPTLAPASAPANAPIYLANYRAGADELPNNQPDLRSAARRVTPSAVHITARPTNLSRSAVKSLFSDRESGPPPSDGEGSGVIYSASGYIVTNDHVIKDAGEILVRTSNRKTYTARLVGEDPKSDLAVLKIDGSNNFPTLAMADSDAAQPGQWVLAVGNPFGLTSTVTAGIVSAKDRNINILRDLDAIESFIQTDAAVNPGNSGGPLVTADGKLLGINTAIASQTGKFQGYSFAIPINLVRRVVDDIIEFGSYQRAFLGVGISTLTDSDVKRLSLKRTEGVLIDEVFAGGSAAAAGIVANDLVVKINERKIRDLPELTEIIGRAKVGETLKITVVRGGKEVTVIVPLTGEE